MDKFKQFKHAYAEAQYRLVQMYTQGEGCAVDKTQVFYWYLQLAESGDFFARMQLWEKAEAQAENADAAIAHLDEKTKALVQKYAEAQFQLGQLYYRGEGCNADKEKSVYWWKKAAEQNHAEARAALARNE
ncbi:sel1 repeat family protein [Treponema phagedenis]|uniref:tetratricopeptide repeat protein n=1 Tax=Treponema phagedenis TaxID=162 RepID=UPI00197FAF6D|nr:SEL1-like repeat protein [Treponema phagedenis]QSH99065.1 sel1 repeat family protein [Treponema phagedenis]